MPSTISRPPALAVAGRLNAGGDGEHAVNQHVCGEQNDKHLHRKLGFKRQIRPKIMPRIPRKPTSHQLSARISLKASLRVISTVGVRTFPDAAFAMIASFGDRLPGGR